jgi:hypothetical protein
MAGAPWPAELKSNASWCSCWGCGGGACGWTFIADCGSSWGCGSDGTGGGSGGGGGGGGGGGSDSPRLGSRLGERARCWSDGPPPRACACLARCALFAFCNDDSLGNFLRLSCRWPCSRSFRLPSRLPSSRLGACPVRLLVLRGASAKQQASFATPLQQHL